MAESKSASRELLQRSRLGRTLFPMGGAESAAVLPAGENIEICIYIQCFRVRHWSQEANWAAHLAGVEIVRPISLGVNDFDHFYGKS